MQRLEPVRRAGHGEVPDVHRGAGVGDDRAVPLRTACVVRADREPAAVHREPVRHGQGFGDGAVSGERVGRAGQGSSRASRLHIGAAAAGGAATTSATGTTTSAAASVLARATTCARETPAIGTTSEANLAKRTATRPVEVRSRAGCLVLVTADPCSLGCGAPATFAELVECRTDVATGFQSGPDSVRQRGGVALTPATMW